MKKGIHPAYHFVEVQLNDGTTYKTRTTHGQAGQKITLDIDPSTHPPLAHRRRSRAASARTSIAPICVGLMLFLLSVATTEALGALPAFPMLAAMPVE